MSITYILSILLMFVLILIMHKTDKKQNIIMWIAIGCILIMCYNILICLIYALLGIQCTLNNLIIANLIVIAILSALIFKSKKLQKYNFEVLDIIFSAIVLILVTFIAYKQYGFPFNIKYEITDGSTHYFFAQQFYEDSTLLYNANTDDLLGIYNSDFRLPGAYVNEGILFKIFDGHVLNINIFIIFDLFVLYLSGIIFYFLVKTYAKENSKIKILAAIFSIVYMLGYPLNSMLYGYVYLSLALDIIITFLLLIENLKKEEITNKNILPILSLISFGVFFTYAYFIPLIYISILASIIVKSIKEKSKLFSQKNIITIIYLIIIPTILGIGYFVILPLVNGQKTEISTIGVDGEIYRNIITNYLIFIPIVIAGIIMTIKEQKELKHSTILLIMSIIFVVILGIGNKLSIVSEYYFYKAYYIIWVMAIYEAFIMLSEILSKKNNLLKIIGYSYITLYIVVILFTTLFLNKNIGINDIYYINAKCIKNESYILTQKQVEVLQKVQNLADDSPIYVCIPETQGKVRWISVLLNNQYVYIDFLTGNEVTINKWLSEKNEKYYLAYYDDYKKITENRDYPSENSSDYKIIYNDELAFVLERK